MIKPRFLLLEDDESIAKFVQSMLSQGDIDCDLIRVDSLTALLTAIKTDSFDLVLADEQTFELSSLEALKILQNQGFDVPFIVLTETETSVLDLLKQGATDYVLKHHFNSFVPVVYRALREGQKRRELQAALDESQARLQTVVANVPGMLYRYVPVNGSARFTFVSSSCRDLFEIEPETALQNASRIWNLIHPDDVASFQQAVDYSVANFLPWEWIGRMLTPSGQLKWIHGESNAVRTDDGIAWDGYLLDISDRKALEESLRQSEQRFRMIVASAKDYAIFTFDLNNLLTSWNVGAQRILQYTESEIIGQQVEIIFSSEDREERSIATETHRTLTQGQSENERWHIRKDGSRFWGSGLIMPLRDDAGEIQGFLKILQDKTEQRQIQEAIRYQADELAKANRIKDEFLAVLSHELRTPLNPILGWIKLLKNGRVDSARMKQG